MMDAAIDGEAEGNGNNNETKSASIPPFMF